MIDYNEVEENNQRVIYTRHRGAALLDIPLLNKGTSFTPEERLELGLTGLLPPQMATIHEQLTRTYENFREGTTDLQRYIYLTSLQDRNEVLYYRLVLEHITEMMPIIYTPVVGLACQRFSHIYRKPRGLYLSYPDRHMIEEMLEHRTSRDIDVIVVTDGERILGLGDQGAGGMGIPIGKLALYTACGGVHPAHTLPILLDVGTNNAERISDPLYLGWRHERVRGEQYYEFIDMFVKAVKKKLPGVLLQWEDFANPQAFPILEKYRNELCTFNDDIQGTAAVTYAALLAAMRATGQRFEEQRIVVLGAGSAGVGISDLMMEDMVARGGHRDTSKFWLIDSQGLVHDARKDLPSTKARWARKRDEMSGWTLNANGEADLLEVVRRVHPTALIGVSGKPGTFPEEVIREMARHTKRPIVFPLSNPTSQVEATPMDILRWTEGRALVATGSPFGTVEFGGKSFPIGQCNNSYIFPGVGLGTIAVKSRRVTDEMFLAAAKALAEKAPINSDPNGSLLPPLERIREVSMHVATAVARKAVAQGLTEAYTDAQVAERLQKTWWEPSYRPTRLRRPNAS